MRARLKEKKCLKGVMESSGIYWVPIYVTLVDNGFQVTVANAHQVKAIPGRKTDEFDSQWRKAYLAMVRYK